MQTINSPTTYEWHLVCPALLCDYASELLAGVSGVDSVQIFYADDEDGETQPYKVACYSQLGETMTALLDVLEQDEQLAPVLAQSPLQRKTITEADWADAWRQHWHVTPLSPHITVRPSWEAHEPTNDHERVLVLDPGSAFGTGAHDTTRLMVVALDDLAHAHPPQPDHRLLDVGTGSGILAIAAALLGWKTVWAVDIDAHAVRVAEENIALNGLSHSIQTYVGDLECLPTDAPFDCIVANILGPVLEELTPVFKQRLKSGGTLLCSGLNPPAAVKLAKVLGKNGFGNITPNQENQWVALKATRL